MLHARLAPIVRPASPRHYAVAALTALLALAASSAGVQPARATVRAGDHLVFLPLTQKARAVAPGLPIDPYATHTGEATFYNADGTGNCSFAATPDDLMVAAMNHADYADSLLCGAYIEIAGPKATIVVRIVDQCPECPAGDIDLSEQAFALIADPVQGRVPITWRIVGPALAGPIVYHFKEGSNQWWTAVQIRNHRNPIFRVEYRNTEGAFVALPRVDYNYFIREGDDAGPYTFRVTDFYGNTITDSGIPLVAGGDVSGHTQFPPPP